MLFNKTFRYVIITLFNKTFRYVNIMLFNKTFRYVIITLFNKTFRYVIVTLFNETFRYVIITLFNETFRYVNITLFNKTFRYVTIMLFKKTFRYVIITSRMFAFLALSETFHLFFSYWMNKNGIWPVTYVVNYYSLFFFCSTRTSTFLVMYEFCISATSVGLVTILSPILNCNLRSLNRTSPNLKLWGTGGQDLKTLWLYHSSLYFFSYSVPTSNQIKTLSSLSLPFSYC
jgi:hypothetical protein